MKGSKNSASKRMLPGQQVYFGDKMPRKKKETEEVVSDVTTKVEQLLPIVEILKSEATLFGEESEGKLPARPDFSPRFLDMATRLVAAGLSQKDLAYIIGTTVSRIGYWKKHHRLFRKACDDGKGIAKSYLIAQGLKAAAGYKTIEKNVKIKRKLMSDGSIIEYAAEESHFIKEVKPDSTLLIFMLANLSRQAKDEIPWTSQHKIEVEGSKTVNIKISGKVATKEIHRLAGAFWPEEIIEAEFEDGKKTDNDIERTKGISGSDTKDDTGESEISPKSSYQNGK